MSTPATQVTITEQVTELSVTNTNAISLRAVQGENSLICHANAQVQLYYNNSLKFETLIAFFEHFEKVQTCS